MLRTQHPWLHVVRSACQFMATAFFFVSLAYISLPEATALADTSPVLITLGAALFLGEKLGPRRIFGVVAALIGALIIIRPGAEVFTLAALLPLANAVAYAGNALLTRHIGMKEPFWTSLMYGALFGAILGGFALPFVWVTPTPWQWVLLLLLGPAGAAAAPRAQATASATSASVSDSSASLARTASARWMRTGVSTTWPLRVSTSKYSAGPTACVPALSSVSWFLLVILASIAAASFKQGVLALAPCAQAAGCDHGRSLKASRVCSSWPSKMRSRRWKSPPRS
jgi:multidrug transporter EmrE-like cation transporter